MNRGESVVDLQFRANSAAHTDRARRNTVARFARVEARRSTRRLARSNFRRSPSRSRLKMAEVQMSSPIENYALIGNLRTAALVDRTGSIDWLCLPRFDSGACFAALLGDEENGRWLLAPQGGVKQVRRKYRDDTLILETEFETESGVATVIDFMPVAERPGAGRRDSNREGHPRAGADANGSNFPFRLWTHHPVGAKTRLWYQRSLGAERDRVPNGGPSGAARTIRPSANLLSAKVNRRRSG